MIIISIICKIKQSRISDLMHIKMKSILKVILKVISREENDTDKSVNEIKDDENDFHTNLSLILNEYKSKQVDFNTRKDKPLNEELENETDNINEKLEILTKDNNKKPVVYKSFYYLKMKKLMKW